MALFSQKKLFLSIFSLLVLCSTGCGSTPATGGGEGIHLSGTLSSCFTDSMKVFEIQGQDLKRIASCPLVKEGDGLKFDLRFSLPQPGLYLVGPNPAQNQVVMIGFDTNGEVTMNSNCINFAQSTVLKGSPNNDQFVAFQNRYSQYQQSANMCAQNLQLFAQSDPAQIPRLRTEADNSWNSFKKFLDSIITSGGPMMKTLAKLHYFNMVPDPANGEDEVTHFKSSFFGTIEMTEASLSYLPMFYQKANNYAQTLAFRGLKDEELKSILDGQLNKAPANSRNRKLLLLGFIDGLDALKSDLFVPYGKAFVKEFPGETVTNARLLAKISAVEKFGKGALAPDLALTTPEGTPLKLSDLKGQYVMIDFWASWCGPCRRENPNVVNAYKKYHSAGFEILGVSLDSDKAKWIQAIQMDGLTWKHMSDLKGWQSVGAQTYEVTSIPATVLVDKEGKIIARNLRGPALEEKLKEIFGF